MILIVRGSEIDIIDNMVKKNMNNLYKDLFGYIPIDKKTKKKKWKRKRKQRINRLIEMASQVPSQYEDESQRWEGLGVVV